MFTSDDIKWVMGARLRMMEVCRPQLIKVIKVNLSLIDLYVHATFFITPYNDPSLSFRRV